MFNITGILSWDKRGGVYLMTRKIEPPPFINKIVLSVLYKKC